MCLLLVTLLSNANRSSLFMYSYVFLFSIVVSSCGIKKDTSALKSSNEFAKGFEIAGNYQQKTISIFEEGGRAFNYVIDADSFWMEQAPQVKVKWPIESIALTSTTQVSFLQYLRAEEVISGINGTQYVYDSSVRTRISEEKIVPIGNGQVLDFEAIAIINPSVILLSGYNADEQTLSKLLSLRVVPVFFIEWKESHPLGRTEWIKVLGEMMDRPTIAMEIFGNKLLAYEQLKLGVKVAQPLTVIAGVGYQGVFYSPGGNSYMAALIADAGGTLPWLNDQATGSITVSFEEFYKEGIKADRWINLGLISTQGELLKVDSRFADFKAFKQGQLYNRNKRINAQGWNDFFESSPMNPEKVLADLIQIFSQQPVNPDSLYYYQPLK